MLAGGGDSVDNLPLCRRMQEMTYAILKFLHLMTAIFSIAGFILRGFWMLTDSPMRQKTIVRVLPHVNDSILLLSGIGLIWALKLSVAGQAWLLTKLLAVVVYIGLGMVALRFGRTRPIRAIAFVMALATFAYAAGVALGKSPLSWLAVAFT
jgi:uncharacterized membrane protein SirB2